MPAMVPDLMTMLQNARSYDLRRTCPCLTMFAESVAAATDVMPAAVVASYSGGGFSSSLPLMQLSYCTAHVSERPYSHGSIRKTR